MRSPIRRFMLVMGSIIFIAVLLPAVIVVVVDPFRIYHDAWFGQGLSDNQRYQNAGIINRYLADPSSPYTTVIAGTSMSDNISSEKLERVFGWPPALRLIIRGGSSREIYHTVLHALDTGRVRHVLFEINLWHYLEDYEADRQDYFPEYLYNNSLFDDYPYVFNISTFMLSLQILSGDLSSNSQALDSIGTSQRQDLKHDDFNANAQDNLAEGYTWTMMLDHWPENKREHQYYSRLEQHLFPVIDTLCNREIEVWLYIAPQSRLYEEERQGRTQEVVYMPRQILKHIASCNNMRLYGFGLMTWLSDLNHFRDSMHYTSQANDVLLHRMRDGRNRLSASTIGDYEDAWIDHVNAHRVHSSYPAPQAFPD